MSVCPHPTCETTIEWDRFACRPHWFSLPPALRNRIFHEWRGVLNGRDGAEQRHHDAKEAALDFWRGPDSPVVYDAMRSMLSVLDDGAPVPEWNGPSWFRLQQRMLDQLRATAMCDRCRGEGILIVADGDGMETAHEEQCRCWWGWLLSPAATDPLPLPGAVAALYADEEPF